MIKHGKFGFFDGAMFGVLLLFIALMFWLAWGEYTPHKPDVSQNNATGQTLLGLGDCEDQDPTVHPGAPELTNDGKDNDCDGETDEMPCVEDADCVPPDGFALFLTWTFWSDGTYLFGCFPPVNSEVGWSCRKCESMGPYETKNLYGIFCNSTESRCDDDIDGDLDGLTDHGDHDCANPPPPP